jgi:hypothetical protein
VNRNARAEKQNACCDPTGKKFDSWLHFPLHSAPVGEQPLAFLIDESIGEPAVASLTCNGSSGSACAFFCFHNLVPQSVEERGKIVQDVRAARICRVGNPGD